MKFTVLMSVYAREKPEYLDSCFESLFKQTHPANEIILVEDGPITEHLNQVIAKWKGKLPIQLVKLRENSGLATALNYGIKHCSNDIIARMDTDDICTLDRFEKQLTFLQENPDIDIVGSHIAEYDETMKQFLHYRKLPLRHDGIVKFAKTRVPFNHMTVVYKKSQVLKVGGYAEHVRIMQDWTLWGKLLKNGRISANIDEVLVNVRTGKELIKRRRGLEYVKSETASIKYLYEIGFINSWYCFYNIVSHTAVRLLPTKIVSYIYSKFLRK